MKNNLTKNYLIQTKQLFGNQFIIKDAKKTIFATSQGDNKSKFLFIKYLNEIKNIEETELNLLNKIVQALNLDNKDILLLNLNNSKQGISLYNHLDN